MKEFNHNKSLGQNFIKDNDIISRIIDCANIDKNTLVIEIGPGMGALSLQLVEKAGYVVLYEIDKRLEIVLREKLKNYNNYELIISDVLKASLKDDIIKYNYDRIVVVANIPYYITTPIINKLVNEVCPNRIVLMVQDEVANRITAKEKNRCYGFMSVIVQSKYKAIKEFVVNKKYFDPIPKVDSAVISLELRDDLDIDNYNYFVKFVGDSFKYKRKNIKNNLKNYDLDIINDILKKYNLSIVNRSEEVPVSVFVELSNIMGNIK